MSNLDFDLDAFDLETIDIGSASKNTSVMPPTFSMNSKPQQSSNSMGGGSVFDDLDTSEFGLDMLVNKAKARKSPELSPSPKPQSASAPAPDTSSGGFFGGLFGSKPKPPVAVAVNKSPAPTMTSIDDLDKEISAHENALNANLTKAKTMSGPGLPPFGNGFGGGLGSQPATQPTVSAVPGYNPGGIGDSLSMTYEEIQKAKFDLLCKFERLKDKGVKIPKVFSMSSDYDEMKYEYERLVHQRKMDNSVHMQRQWLISAVSGIEFLNTRYDPFDFKLDGWSTALHEDINKYDDIFEELYEKYQASGNMAPELRLIFMVAGSALTHHMTMSMLKNSNLPNADEVLRSNPDLMRQFQEAQAASMSQQAPGFSGFMGNMMNNMMGGGNKSRNDGPPLYDAGAQNKNNIPDLDTILGM